MLILWTIFGLLVWGAIVCLLCRMFAINQREAEE